MLFLPEIKLQKFCAALFSYLVNNYNMCVANGHETNSHLYLLFHKDVDNVNGEENYYKQAVEIFSRKKDNARALVVSSVFNRNRANLPTIHVVVPQDIPSMSYLGDAHGENYANGRMKIERAFSGQFSFLVTSDNIMEVQIITYVLRALLLSTPESLASLGFINPKFTAQEVSLGPDVVPANTYIKGVNMDAAYVEITPPVMLEDQQAILNYFWKMDCSCEGSNCGL